MQKKKKKKKTQLYHRETNNQLLEIYSSILVRIKRIKELHCISFLPTFTPIIFYHFPHKHQHSPVFDNMFCYTVHSTKNSRKTFFFNKYFPRSLLSLSLSLSVSISHTSHTHTLILLFQNKKKLLYYLQKGIFIDFPVSCCFIFEPFEQILELLKKKTNKNKNNIYFG